MVTGTVGVWSAVSMCGRAGAAGPAWTLVDGEGLCHDEVGCRRSHVSVDVGGGVDTGKVACRSVSGRCGQWTGDIGRRVLMAGAVGVHILMAGAVGVRVLVACAVGQWQWSWSVPCECR